MPTLFSRLPVLAVLLSLAAAPARAGNDEGVPLGDDAALTGNAVAAMVSDGSSLVYNPAGLARAARDQVDVSATATLLRFYAVPGLVADTAGRQADGNFTEFLSVPAAVSYVRPLDQRLRIGFGLFVPDRASTAVSSSL